MVSSKANINYRASKPLYSSRVFVTQSNPTTQCRCIVNSPRRTFNTFKKLESPEDWPSWHKQIKNCLIMTGFTAILERQTEMPKQHEAGGENNENEANGAYQARLEAWMDKQSQAFATVDETCGYRASKLMAEKEKKTPIKQALEVLDKEFKESGSGRYEDLCATFNDLSLSNCKNVSDYGAQIQKVTDDMQTLHSTVALPESFVVQKFLHASLAMVSIPNKGPYPIRTL